jgi:phosphohistidine swiveling domain-containing protein
LRRGWRSGRVGDLGLAPASTLGYPPKVEDRALGTSYGRLTANINQARKVWGALPGVSGDDVERDLLGSSREGVVDEHHPRRVPALLTSIPRVLVAGRGRPRQNLEDLKAYWRSVVGPDGLRDGVWPEDALRESLDWFTETLRYQIWMRLFMQAVSAQLGQIARKVDEPNALGMLLAGAADTEEALIADDLYRVAKGGMTLDAFLAEHGYQGPSSGLPTARIWREDRRALERLLTKVEGTELPEERRRRANVERDRAAAAIVAKLPAVQRPMARLLISVAPSAARGLECTKAAMIISVDVGRAAARALGAQFAAIGTLDDPEDVFFLFADELMDARGKDLRELVAARRATHARFEEMELPETWDGMPSLEDAAPEAAGDEGGVVSGVGASAGVVEGRVRLVMDAADDVDIDDGDILVCPTTDPSWVSLMMVASALVIDLGAAVSHGAIVARELGVPCVIGTGNGTRVLHDGDLVRVDGGAGTVEVLARSDRSAALA